MKRNPGMLSFLLGHLVVGAVAGWAVLAGVIWLDIASLRTLIFSSPDGPVALAVLAIFFAITFGSLGMGVGVMAPWERARRSEDEADEDADSDGDDDAPPPGRGRLALQRAPARRRG